jgi:hypothetical protein
LSGIHPPPKVFTRPWRIAMPLYRRVEPNMQLLEFRCNEFVEEFRYGNLRKQPLVKHWEGDTMTIDVTRKVPPGDLFYHGTAGDMDGRQISQRGIGAPPQAAGGDRCERNLQ